MTILTLVQTGQLSTADETLIDNYITQQMSAGTTNGIKIQVIRTGVPGNPLSQREWTTVEAATAWLTFCNTSLNPAPTYAVVVS